MELDGATQWERGAKVIVIMIWKACDSDHFLVRPLTLARW